MKTQNKKAGKQWEATSAGRAQQAKQIKIAAAGVGCCV